MFTCATCKKFVAGLPTMVNATGAYCAVCETNRKNKVAEATKARWAEMSEACIWCGDAGPHKDKYGVLSRVCRSCDTGRDWLLRCIRHSNKAADYTAKTEERELPIRREKHAQAAAALVAARDAVKPTIAPIPAPVDSSDRIDRLEKMILKLTEALGGAP